MLKYFPLLLLLSFLLISCKDQSVNSQLEEQFINETEKKVASSSDRFGLKLLREINNSEPAKNIFISPLSVSAALGMTLNGANGATYEAMRNTLELQGMSDKEINESFSTLFSYLLKTDPKVMLSIANSIWYANNFNVEQEFVTTNRDYFKSSVTSLDFTDENSVNIINDWVNDNTKGLIDKVLERIPADAVMYLINAIYFKGNWTYSFNKDATAIEPFYHSDGTSADCNMMNQKNKFEYFKNNDLQAVRLPYGGGNFNMEIYLPASGKNVNDLVNEFTPSNYEIWNNSFTVREGNLWLPKFKMDYQLQMKDVLTTLGMGIAFEGSADFSKISKEGNLAISSVLHKTFVDVNEEGTEAAGVTVVEIIKTSIGDDESSFNMKVNRPFVFIISEKATGAILFIGKVVKL